MHQTTHPILQTFLWLLPTTLEISIALRMMSRGLSRTLPVFFLYLVLEIVRTIFLFLVRKDVYLYFYGYWVTELIGCLMALWVSKELFDHVFSRNLGLRRLGDVLFKGSLLVLIVSAVLWARIAPGTDTARIIAGILVLKRAVTLVQVGILATLYLSGLGLGLAWDHYVTGIALGFGVYGAVELGAITARTIYGRAAETPYNWTMMSIGNCCVLIWAFYFLLSAGGPAKSPKPIIPDSRMLKDWDDAVAGLLRT